MEQKPKPAEDRGKQRKISRDVAEAEFQRFLDCMRLNFTTEGLDAEDRTQVELHKKRFVNAVMDGRLVVDQKGIPTYTPRDSADKDPITFPQPKGGDFMQADLHKKNHDITKGMAIMAAATHQPLERYRDMEWSDFRVCQAISGLYMGGE